MESEKHLLAVVAGAKKGSSEEGGRNKKAYCAGGLKFAHSSGVWTSEIFWRKKKAHLGIRKLGFASLVPVMAYSNLHQERLGKKKKRCGSHTGTSMGARGFGELHQQ
jgi:hypothetical protein